MTEQLPSLFSRENGAFVTHKTVSGMLSDRPRRPINRSPYLQPQTDVLHNPFDEQVRPSEPRRTYTLYLYDTREIELFSGRDPTRPTPVGTHPPTWTYPPGRTRSFTDLLPQPLTKGSQ